MSKIVRDIFQEKSFTRTNFLISVELKYASRPIGDRRQNWASAEKKVDSFQLAEDVKNRQQYRRRASKINLSKIKIIQDEAQRDDKKSVMKEENNRENVTTA